MSRETLPEITPDGGSAKPLEATIKIGNEYAHVHTTPEALQKNLIAEAVKQGIPENTAHAHAEQTTCFLDTAAFFASKHLSSDPSLAKSVLEKVLSPLRQNRLLGVVRRRKEGDTICLVAVEQIVKRVNRDQAHHSPEVGEATIMQEVDAVWRHERQHLIQNMSPEISEAKKKLHQTLKNIYVGLSGVALTTACAELLPVDSSTREEFTVIALAASVGLAANYYYHSKLSPPERDAYRMEKPEHYIRNSPFEISFEK